LTNVFQFLANTSMQTHHVSHVSRDCHMSCYWTTNSMHFHFSLPSQAIFATCESIGLSLMMSELSLHVFGIVFFVFYVRFASFSFCPFWKCIHISICLHRHGRQIQIVIGQIQKYPLRPCHCGSTRSPSTELRPPHVIS
jgi:hypothetical protein